MEQLMMGLLLWISQHTMFEYQPEMGLPNVEQVTQQKLAELYMGTDESRLGYLSDADKESIFNDLTNSLEVVYASDNNTIYLGEKIEPESTYGRSVMVHELVHFLQNKNDMHKQVTCKNALEKDAYLIQSDYMVQNNTIPPFNRFTIMMRSLCEDDF